MSLMHHRGLRVNAAAVDDADAMAVYAESGWRPGPHPDSDPDDPSAIPAVLPATQPEPTPVRRRATSKKAS